MNGDIPWHIFMALHYIQKLINNMYRATKNKDSPRENCCDCKRIWQNRGSFYDP